MKIFSVAPIVFFLIISSPVSGVTLIENQTWQAGMTPARFGAMALGDIDNDGDMDIVSTGCLSDGGYDCENGVIAKIYTNNGAALLENIGWGRNLTTVGLSSVAWGDVNNDGNLDLALTGCNSSDSFICNGNRFSKIYINNGTSLVENQTWQQNLIPVAEGSLAWGDVDNDGDLDLAQIGLRTSQPYRIAKIYINNDSSLAESPQWQNELEGVQRGNIAFADIDNDWDLDLVLSGYDESTTAVTKIYINNGTSLVENQTWQQDLTSMGRSSVLWGDYDNDGDLDLVMNGQIAGDRFHVYNNNGNTFVLNQTDIPGGGILGGLYSSSVAFGDYDNDGDLDLIAMGWEHGRTKIYKNNNNIFENDPAAHSNISDDLYEGSLAWSDVDGDGTLDVVATGYIFNVGMATKVYVNDGVNKNDLPYPPIEGFIDNYSSGKLELSWGNGTDNETSNIGLYYNLRAGTCSGCHDVVSGVYGGNSGSNEGGGGGANGYFGNMMQRKSITLNRHFEPGTKIYWAVQTIDTGLAKSEWSEEQVYVILGGCEPEWSCSSWGSCQPGGTQSCNSWVDSNNCGVPYSGSNTRSCTYKPPSISGGPSYVPPSPQHTFNTITPGTPVSKELTGGVNVTIDVKETVTNVDIVVTVTSDKPPAIEKSVKGKVYTYLEINSSGIDNSDIEEAVIEFNVSRNWISQNNIDVETVALHRYYNNEWDELETELVTSDNGYYYYTANTPGFSYFVIAGEVVTPPPVCNNNSICEAGVGEDEENCPNDCVSVPERLCSPSSKRCSGNELQECNPLGTVWISKELCVYGCDSERLACNPPAGSSGDVSWYIAVVSVMAVAIIAVVYLMKKKSKKPRTLEEALEGVQPI